MTGLAELSNAVPVHAPCVVCDARVEGGEEHLLSTLDGRLKEEDPKRFQYNARHHRLVHAEVVPHFGEDETRLNHVDGHTFACSTQPLKLTML